jgi:VCBS repeat-containing protein/parallel beta-helix repeat protein
MMPQPAWAGPVAGAVIRSGATPDARSPVGQVLYVERQCGRADFLDGGKRSLTDRLYPVSMSHRTALLATYPPVANDDVAATDAAHGVWLNLTGNDTDPYGDRLAVTQLGTAGTLGTVTMNPTAVNGAWYVPGPAFASLSAGETATDSFTYTVTDAHGGTATASAAVTITGVNQAPVAHADTAVTSATQPVQIAVLANDTDVNRDDVLSVTVLDPTGTRGSVQLGAGGIVTYTPGAAFAGLVPGTASTDSFAYTISDGHGGTSRGTVSVKVTAPGASPVSPTALYVATDGNDSWSGQLAAPDAAGTDGPLASLQAAQAKMEAGTTKTTYIEGGTYNLHASLNLGSADSGESWLAYPGQTPVIEGGQSVTGWTQQANGLWTANAPAGAFALGGAVADLFVDGVRQTHARYPNAVPSMPVRGGWLPVQQSLTGENTATSFQFRPGDLPVLTSTAGLYAAVYQQNGWQEYTLPVASINMATDTITLAGASEMPIDIGSRFYLYNAASQLDAAHEWFYNPATNIITYDAPAGFIGGNVTVGSLANIVTLSNANNVTISGLTLTGAASTGTAVQVNDSTGLHLAGDTIDNVGNGVVFSGTGGSDRIEGSVIENTDNDGILINPGTSNVTVTGNKIHDIGQLLNGSAVWFTGSSNDTFTYNTVQSVARVGIGGGSAIGLSDASYNDVISYNMIKNTNLTTSDGGAIVLGGMQQTATGDIVSYNEISGTKAAGTGETAALSFLPNTQLNSYGIYLDDFASGVTVKGNVLHDNVGGILLHSGSNNLVTDNIIANSSGMATLYQADNWRGTGAQPPSGNLFTGNLISNAKPGGPLAVNLGDPSNAQWTDNYYDASGLFGQAFISDTGGVLDYLGLAGWQAGGYDAGSLTGASGLQSTGGTYSLPANSAARGLGVTSPPTTSIGLSGFSATSHYDLFGQH